MTMVIAPRAWISRMLDSSLACSVFEFFGEGRRQGPRREPRHFLSDGPQTDTDTSEASDSQTRCGGAAYRMSYRKMCGTESKNDASVGSSEYQRVMVCSGCQTPPLCESGWRDLNPRPLRSE